MAQNTITVRQTASPIRRKADQRATLMGLGLNKVGRTRTRPAADSRQPVRLGVSSCQHYSYGYFTPHAHAAADDLDLYVFLGDYVYEARRPPAPTEPRQDQIDSNDLRSYRDKYQLYRSDPNLRKMHARFPMISIWDDHEVVDNYAGGAGPSGGLTP